MMPQTISAEKRRRLSPVSYSTSNLYQTLDLPKDTSVKYIDLRCVGVFQVTYATGAPVADSGGFMARLCNRLDVQVDGSDYVKSIDLYMQSKFNLLESAIQPERAYSSSAGAPTTRVAGTESASGAPFVYPATTQYVLVNESVKIHMECWPAYSLGKEGTVLNLRGRSSALMAFNFTDISNLQRAEAAPVSITYGSVDVQFVPTLLEAPEIPATENFPYFKESVRRYTYNGEQRDTLIDLPRGNLLTGIGFLVRNGDANKSLSDIALTDIGLRINGSQILQQTKFLELQQGNRSRYGISAPKTGGVHSLLGFAHMNLLKNGDIRSAVNTTQQAGVDQIQLQISTAASAGNDAATYTNPVEVSVWTQEIQAAPKRL